MDTQAKLVIAGKIVETRDEAVCVAKALAREAQGIAAALEGLDGACGAQKVPELSSRLVELLGELRALWSVGGTA